MVPLQKKERRGWRQGKEGCKETEVGRAEKEKDIRKLRMLAHAKGWL